MQCITGSLEQLDIILELSTANLGSGNMGGLGCWQEQGLGFFKGPVRLHWTEMDNRGEEEACTEAVETEGVGDARVKIETTPIHISSKIIS